MQRLVRWISNRRGSKKERERERGERKTSTPRMNGVDENSKIRVPIFEREEKGYSYRNSIGNTMYHLP